MKRAAAIAAIVFIAASLLVGLGEASLALLRVAESFENRVEAIEARALAHPMSINHGVSFSISCDTTSAGVPVVEATSEAYTWNSLYCENNSTTSVFWGFGQTNGTAFDTAKAPCISTTSSSCLSNGFSIDAFKGSVRCKTASGSATLLCNAGGP